MTTEQENKNNENYVFVGEETHTKKWCCHGYSTNTQQEIVVRGQTEHYCLSS